MIDLSALWSEANDFVLIDIVALTLLVLTAIVTVRLHDLLASAAILGIFSLLMALLYLLMDAPDVALTESAVGAGISTVLFLLALTFTPRMEKQMPPQQSTIALLIVVIVGAALLYAIEGLPPYGAVDAPAHQNTTPYYLENMPSDIDIPNLVTSILASYRGFDTMGEVGVIFTAGIGMAALLINLPQRRSPDAPAENPAKKAVSARRKAKTKPKASLKKGDAP